MAFVEAGRVREAGDDIPAIDAIVLWPREVEEIVRSL